MPKNKAIYLAFQMLIFAYSTSQAGGIQLQFQSAKQAGMAHIGYGKYWGAASIYFNPATITMSNRHEIEMGMAGLKSFTTYSGQYPSAYNATTNNYTQSPVHFYGIFHNRFEQKWAIGLAINTPFNYQNQWDKDWNGRFMIQNYDVSVLNIQPTFAYKLTENLSIGVGFNTYLGNLSIQKAIPLTTVNNLEGKSTLTARGIGFGANVGVTIRPSERFSLGLNFKTGSNLQFNKGDAVFDVPSGFRRSYPNSNFKTNLKSPRVLNLGITFRANERLSYELALGLNNWTKTDSIRIDYQENALKDERVFKNYKTAFVFRLGCEQKIKDWLFWRWGAYYDMTAIRDEFVSPEIPDANRIGLTTGIGLRINKFNFQLSGEYQFTGERAFLYKAGDFAGFYNLNAFCFGAGIRYVL